MLPLKEKRIYSVVEITQDIKIILENSFGEVWVEGEVSNFKAYPSGHFYFTLKDAQAVLSAVMFSRANRGLKFKIEDGMKVVCFGSVGLYPARGQYQLIIERVEPKGIGAQQLAFEQLKERLFKEGLFAPERKKPLPLMPFRVGIVTSSAGAAVRDILQILKKGAPCVGACIRSVRVQGVGAADEIAQGVVELNQFKEIDAIIICRGGGSAEDLWSFNEEVVARAIYHSKIPTISAVGHQINTTLSDLVADVFVETPSAAAKVIVDKKKGLCADIESLRYEMTASMQDVIHGLKNNVVALSSSLKSPLDRLMEKEQLVGELAEGLRTHIAHYLAFTRQKTSGLIQRLDALSPLAVLSRGYSLTMRGGEDVVVKDASELRKGDTIKTILEIGACISEVQEVHSDGKKTTV